MILCKGRRLQNTQHFSRATLRQQQRQVGFDLMHTLLLQCNSATANLESGDLILPDDLLGSITHTGDSVFAALAARKHFSHLGLDSEIIISAARADRLAKRILTAAEKMLWQNAKLAWPDFVTLIFSIKEAAYKALPKVEQSGLGFQNFLVAFDDFNPECPIKITIQHQNSTKCTQMNGNWAIFDHQVLCAVWQVQCCQES